MSEEGGKSRRIARANLCIAIAALVSCGAGFVVLPTREWGVAFECGRSCLDGNEEDTYRVYEVVAYTAASAGCLLLVAAAAQLVAARRTRTSARDDERAQRSRSWRFWQIAVVCVALLLWLWNG